MSQRFFVEDRIEGNTARLVAGEAHHLLHVMRAKPGDTITLFDDSGAEFTARIERLGRADVELAILARAEVDREPRVALTLGVPLPKGDRQRYLVEKATELGVARLVPLVCEHSSERAAGSALQKLRRAVIEASKQCGRNRLLQISEPLALDAFLTGATDVTLRLIAHPGGPPLASVLRDLSPSPASLAVGPEGGFTAGEIALAETHAWQPVDLGPRTLRVETAALALVAAVLSRVE